MGLPRNSTLTVVDGDELAKLPLTPEDFFLVSRIEGEAKVADVIAASGLDAKSAEKILGRLVEIGALKLSERSGDDRRSRTRATRAARETMPDAGGMKDRAKARRAQMLQAQLKGKKAVEGGGSDASGRGKSDESARGSQAEAKRAKDAESKSEPAPPREPERVPADDPRISATLDMSAESQRRLLWLKDNLASLTHFDILGVEPTMDAKLVRRAYHKSSREFHPDSFYGKNIGEFRELAAELFKRAKASYELLMDETNRSRYVERLFAEERKKQAVIDRVEADERSRREEVESAERRRRELEEAVEAMKQAEEEQERLKARAARDEERRRRKRARITGRTQRNSKAQGHYERGMQEMEAGREGAAASLFRLAMDLEPNNAEYHNLWQRSLALARNKRAEKAFRTAERYLEMGQPAEAAHYFRDAAEANPTARNLAEAAAAVAGEDPSGARDFAMSALDALRAAENIGAGVGAEQAARVHVLCGRAFLAAGQGNSAKAQAELALKKNPKDSAARTLLNSIKVT